MAIETGIWAGVGFESGGEILFGLGSQAGVLLSIDDLCNNPMNVRWCSFLQESATIGAGLGGSGGFNLVVGYNAAVPSDFEGASVSFDFSIDLVLGKLDKYVRNLPELIEMAAMARNFDRTWMSIAAGLKKYENAVLLKAITENVIKNHGGIAEAVKMEPCLLSFPLPGLTGGLRLSLKYKAEETSLISFGGFEHRKA